MTECNRTAFPFEGHFSRRVVAKFDGAQMTTEGGALLLRETDRKIGLLKRVAACFTDTRDPQRTEHGLSEMLAQRIYGLALGYEDLNDHEELRPMSCAPDRAQVHCQQHLALRKTALRLHQPNFLEIGP
jgi:hypothetical protein